MWDCMQGSRHACHEAGLARSPLHDRRCIASSSAQNTTRGHASVQEDREGEERLSAAGTGRRSSLATAATRLVFPVPGGPCSR